MPNQANGRRYPRSIVGDVSDIIYPAKESDRRELSAVDEGDKLNSDDEMQRELAIDELKSLRSEHDARVGKQQDISNVAVALLAAAIAALTFGLRDTTSAADVASSLVLALALPIVAILALTLNLMILDHEQNIAQIQTYICTHLLPHLSRPGLNPEVNWIRYRAQEQQRGATFKAIIGSSLPSAKHAFCFVPATACIVAFPFVASNSAAAGTVPPLLLAWIVYALSVIFWVLAIAGMIHTSRLYLQLARA